MIQEELRRRGIPELLQMADGTPVTAENWRARRAELLDLLRREEYGYSPDAPDGVRVQIQSRDEQAFAGKAVHEKAVLEFDTPNGPFSFPFQLVIPRGAEKIPSFLHLNFRPNIPDRSQPTEEIIDHGFAVITLYYEEVTNDHWPVRPSNPFADGLAGKYPRDEQTGWGKIGMWAFAASRVMDYLVTRPELDPERVAIIGHSRLGKTALWCGAQDERFSLVISNDSGCAGAALFRGRVGEDIEFMARVIAYWFCGNYCAYANREDELPFDQHALLAMIAPRALYVGSGSLDDWADPRSEFLATAAASEVWELLGEKGLVTPDEFPGEDCVLDDGGIAYQVHKGPHYLGRTDWLRYMAFREKNGLRF